METTVEYTIGRLSGRRGKTFVGGYIETVAADRLRRACELNDCTMVDLLELMASKVVATFEPQGCACEHE